jgi:hypothetical protein
VSGLRIEQDTPYMPTLHVRTASLDIAATIAAVRREFDAIDKGFPVFSVKTLQLRIEDSLARERMVAALSAASGVLALWARHHCQASNQIASSRHAAAE